MKKLSFLFVLLSLLLIVSCNDDDDDTKIVDSGTIADNEILSDEILNDIDDNVDDEISSLDIELKKGEVRQGPKRNGKTGAIIQIDTLVDDEKYKYQITFDYETGKEDKKGNIRKGKLILKKGGSKEEKTRFEHISFEDFYINDQSISGTKERTKVKAEDAGILFTEKFNLIINDSLSFKGLKTKEVTAGFKTKAFLDDEFKINGNDTLISPSDNKYRKLTDLIRKTNYRFFISGTIDVKSNEKNYNLDFGDGSLDSLATLTVDGVSSEIVLNKKSKIKGKSKRDD
ncbi:MAG: hypothetical protein N4A49_06295 [Marinifilaceae bacterium]|jgi:hypothetical protein|nr:hypothetical protein [Marinifilaceae bacterium]